MNREIAASTTIAPIAMINAVPPLSPDDPELGLDVVRIWGVVVVVVSCDGEIGTPGDRGFDPAPTDGIASAELDDTVDVVCVAAAAIGTGSAATTATSDRHATVRTARRSPLRRFSITKAPPQAHYRSDASGCSIAGVSGASLYGCSGSTCSSWYTLSALTAQMS